MKIFLSLTIFLFISFNLYAHNFEFAILSDRSGGPNQKAFEKIINQIVKENPEILLTVGDFVEDGDLEDWDVFLKTMEQVKVPIYYAPGNNDIFDETSRKIYIEKTGRPPFYSFDYKNVHFIILDNSMARSYQDIDSKQIKWFKEDLDKQDPNDLIMVFMHKPFWADTIRIGKDDSFHELLVKSGVDAVFTGHWHKPGYLKKDGIEYFLLGSSGGAMAKVEDRYKKQLGLFYQFYMCKVDKGSFSVEMVDSDGRRFPKDTMLISETHMLNKIRKKLIKVKGEFISNKKMRIDIKIKNPTSKIIRSQFVTNTQNNWQILGENTINVSLEPLNTFKHQMLIKQTGSLFPLPRASFLYPFGRDKIFPFSNTILLQRKIELINSTSNIIIDGNLSDTEWKNAVKIDEWSDRYGNKSPTESTKVYAKRVGSTLFIAIIATETQMDKFKNKATKHDQAVYKDDSLSVLLANGNGIYYHFYVNSLGTIWDARVTLKKGYDESWNGKMKARGRKKENSWLIELGLDLSELEFDFNNPIWINMKRNQTRTDKHSYFQPDWSLSHTNYGKVIFK